MTAAALANLMAVLVDTMGDAGLPPPVILRFLDRLDSLNEMQLWGEPLEFLEMVVGILRRSVASND